MNSIDMSQPILIDKHSASDFQNPLTKYEHNDKDSDLAQSILEEILTSGTPNPELIDHIIANIQDDSSKLDNETIQKILIDDFESAYEHIPELFIPVDMIKIPVTINGVTIIALLDTGAQVSVISKNMAIKCKLDHRINPDYKTQLQGVGTSDSPGKIFNVDIELGEYTLAGNLTVMVSETIDLLFGLDMMKSHRLSVDFDSNCIRNMHMQVPFFIA